MKRERFFFSRKEAAAITTFIGDLRHDRKTRAHLLARCNDDPIKVLEYFREHVTREIFQGSEILQRIAAGLRREGYGHKLRFKASEPTPPTPVSTMEKISSLPFADILRKRGLTQYAVRHLQLAA